MGATATVNYTLGKNTADLWADNATQSFNYATLRDKGRNIGPSPFDVRHVLQAYGTYDLPFGKDRHFNLNNGVLNAVAGGWVVSGILTAQSGTPFRLSSGRQTLNQEDAGVVLMGGMTAKELQKLIKVLPGPGFNRYFIDPKLIGSDGRANPAFLAPPTTPGEMGQLIYLRTPSSWNLDAAMNKTVSLTSNGGVQMTLHITATNVLNHPVWGIGPASGGIGLNFLNDANITSTTFGQTPQPANGSRGLHIRTEIKF
jgi:hypothetical protein